MKRLTVAILVFNLFTPGVFAQTVICTEGTTQRQCTNSAPGWLRTVSAQTPQRQRILSGWQRKVERAERHYKNKHGRYGDLAALRNAHLLRGLTFEPCPSADRSGKEKTNFIPQSTVFRVAATPDGQLFHLMIVDGAGHCDWDRPSLFEHRDFDDSPQGPVISLAR